MLLPKAALTTSWWRLRLRLRLPSASAGAAVVKVVKVIPRQFDAGRLMAPKPIPKEIAMIKEEELPPSHRRAGVVGGVPGGVPGGHGRRDGGMFGAVGAPPPPPPPVSRKSSRRHRSASAWAATCRPRKLIKQG